MKKGIHAFYKLKGISSYDVIRQLKEHFPGEKIGHGGTLDPLAEGVLVIAIGKEYTARLQAVLKETQKIYVAEIELGKTSVTDDSEGPFTEISHEHIPSLEEIQDILNIFIGNIFQIPPVYSAIKIKGRPAYARARKGEQLVLEPKSVTIHSIQLIEYNYPLLTIEVTTASGVYIRSLARDIGSKLQTGGYLKNLLRRSVGDYTIESAIKL